jgi:hypothetical protein
LKLTDKTNKPRSIKPDLTNIPEELRELNQFIMWRYVWRDGCWAKVPTTISGSAASVTNSSTWSTFDECFSKLESDSSFDGVGFVFTQGDPYVGVDIDECVNGALDAEAQALVKQLGSYTEYSPSGTGVHAICKGSVPKAARGKLKGSSVEIYSSGRYFTLTGKPVDEVRPVAEKTMALRRMVNEIQQERKLASEENTVERLLKSALEKPHIKKLFDGDISGYEGPSEADMALCAKLAKYAGGSRDLLDKMFRQSKLFRDKWDSPRGSSTYGKDTIAKIIERDSGVVAEFATSAKEARRAGRFTVDSLWDRVMAFRESGDAKGFDPGWTELGKYYRPTMGAMSVLLGIPSSGKSTFIDALTYNLCKNHNWRVTMASFESLPIERHINNLCALHLQKPTYTFVEGYATDKEMDDAREELNECFNFISPVDDDMTLDTMLEYVKDDIEEFGVNGFVLDPWTELDVSNSKSELDSIKNGLKQLQQFTRNRELHSWVLVHPTKSSETYKKEERGMRPTLYSASGAAHFYNKADFGLVIHRWDDDIVSVYVDKVRNSESSGGKGSVSFKFDKYRRLYVEEEVDSWGS